MGIFFLPFDRRRGSLAELDMREIPFGDLPLYSYDYDSDFP
jgi:hypothetical protein